MSRFLMVQCVHVCMNKNTGLLIKSGTYIFHVSSCSIMVLSVEILEVGSTDEDKGLIFFAILFTLHSRFELPSVL